MRDHSHHIELTGEEAVAGMLRLIDEADAFKPRVEQMSVADSIGRVLARDAVAQVNVPDCLTCNMDSVAVHWSAFEGLGPGQLPDTSAWVRGADWEFANTGVAMPEGFDAAVVLNAGSSKGSDDWCVEVLEELGQVVCHQTNHGPGHHSSYALVGNTPVVGISGPPAGASFTLNFYLRPLIMRWLGMSVDPVRVPVRLTASFPKGGLGQGGPKPGASMAGEVRPPEPSMEKGFFAIKFLRVEAAEDGTLRGTPLPGRPGSPECENANAFYMLPTGKNATPPAAGDVVWVEFR